MALGHKKSDGLDEVIWEKKMEEQQSLISF
jgi:hypothetical protein